MFTFPPLLLRLGAHLPGPLLGRSSRTSCGTGCAYGRGPPSLDPSGQWVLEFLSTASLLLALAPASDPLVVHTFRTPIPPPSTQHSQ